MSRPNYDPDPKTDKWFNWKGVQPPRRFPHMTEDEIRNQLKQNLVGHKCEWKQAGNEIYCEAGDFRHGKMIRPNQRLIYKDGKPNLVAIQPVSRNTKRKASQAKRSDSRPSS